MIVLVISCFLARFSGWPQDGGKGKAYMRKRFAAVTETEREMLQGRNEWEGEWRGFPSQGWNSSWHPG